MHSSESHVGKLAFALPLLELLCQTLLHILNSLIFIFKQIIADICAALRVQPPKLHSDFYKNAQFLLT